APNCRNRISTFSYPRSICSIFWIVLVPFADKAAISKDIPALISGEVICVALSCDLNPCPIITARRSEERRVGQNRLWWKSTRHTRFSRDWSSDVCSSDLSTQLSQSDIYIFVSTVDLFNILDSTCSFRR